MAVQTPDAEVIACSDCAKRLVWIKSILSELGFETKAADLYEDNQACLSLVQSSRTTDRTRHIDVRHWWTRELVGKNIIEFSKVDTEENVADFFTKILPVAKQREYIKLLVASPS